MHIRELVVIGTPAMKARGKKLLDRLNRLTAACSASSDPA
jgi:hypothetical protein